MSVAVVTTTIHAESKLGEWAKLLGQDDHLIIAEDHKTPHTELRRWINGLADHYGFTPIYTYDEPLPYVTSEVIGWNTIQRRNIAVLRALERHPDIMITVDDDNAPASADHIDKLRDLMRNDGTVSLSIIHAKSGWYNVGQMLDPVVTHRGFPLSQRNKKPYVEVTRDAVPIGVHASLWLEDPDIDAIERICCDPVTSLDHNIQLSHTTLVLATDTWCPFNTQATAYCGIAAQLFVLPPGLGRYDDIWGSYITRHMFDYLGYFVSYGVPLVYQQRNPHNLIADLKAELLGLEFTERFIEVLRSIKLSAPRSNPLNLLEEVCVQLAERSDAPLTDQARDYLALWHEDVRLAVTGA